MTFLRPKQEEEVDEDDNVAKGIKIHRSPAHILIIYAIFVTVTTLPFMIGHMVMLTGTTLCLLDRWLSIDQQAKAASIVFTITMAIAGATVGNKRRSEIILLVTSYSLLAFYLYQILNLTYGITLFFHAK